MNTDAPRPSLEAARDWVLRMQTKLHQWATDASQRRFDDLYNLVHHPCTLEVAWDRVRANRGARSAGVDGVRPRAIGAEATRWLAELRADLKAQQFRPDPVRERQIPKPGTSKVRRLGIPTARDRVVQAALKLVLEPIFEADFQPCSYGFRPKRRAQDAIAEIHFLASRSYAWVCEADIEACFDEISHSALLQRVRGRIGDKRILSLLKAFLKAGILSEEGVNRESITGTPQGGILTPPIMLQNAPIERIGASRKRVWRYAEHDVHLGVVDLDTADECANNFASGEPISGFKTHFHLSGEVFQTGLSTGAARVRAPVHLPVDVLARPASQYVGAGE